MAVEVNSERKGVEISWDPMGVGEERPPGEVRPPEFPSYPIELPPEGGSGEGGDAHPEHPIYYPPGIWGPTDPRPGQGLPGDQPEVGEPEFPTQLPEFPPDIGLDDEQKQKLKEFLTGNLPPAAQPTGGLQKAVQVFGQGQDGDWSNTAVMPNDGKCALSYPKGFTGESYIEVRALDGTLVDSGTITVE